MQPFVEKYKKQVTILGSVLAVIVVYFFFIQDSSNSATIETIDQNALATIGSTPNIPETEMEDTPQTIIVDVKGAVKFPGVYTLSEEQRIIDAIEAAGGYTDDANPMLINHAQKLQDEMVVYIPNSSEDALEEMELFLQMTEINSTSSGNSSGKININKAAESELTQLPGIGPSKASAIIQHRSEQGNFRTVEDLKQVTGIGDKTFEQLKDLIDVK
ncbi:helix-hairpin-helix domain-containing protein [Solibacillus merdavium]|uniref:Helix-hairpin-helix domain-containing protein n=1 Tax=Solibacillus merdavium TaxID=2762218 RepID=A0ABR8XJG0_9BACL|nr:helix-hairpin-helix domain-containing protein [Solibacillus merdavium]MBD8032051.1 helix-hairpin-helix domain-containing protein [Solibacillus merdavium]